jgi:hypothetical protein
MRMSEFNMLPFMCESLSFGAKYNTSRLWGIVLGNLYGARYK